MTTAVLVWVVLVWVIDYMPVPVVFDTHTACRELELSLKRQASANFRPTPTQIQGAGYDRYRRATPYFAGCTPLFEKQT